jgi:hypothetical protein
MEAYQDYLNPVCALAEVTKTTKDASIVATKFLNIGRPDDTIGACLVSHEACAGSYVNPTMGYRIMCLCACHTSDGSANQ